MGNRQKLKNLRNYERNTYLRFGKLRGSYLFTSYQFAKVKDQINIGPGYQVISVNGMCRSTVIIYQNETKFEIYCNDKTERHHISENILKVAINTITWVWTKFVTFRSIVNVEKIYCDFFSCDFFFYRRNTYLRYYIEHRHYININSIQSMISKKSWTWNISPRKENNSVYYFRERISLYSCDIVERRTNLMSST